MIATLLDFWFSGDMKLRLRISIYLAVINAILAHNQVDKFWAKTAVYGCISRYATVYLRTKRKEQ